MTYIYPREYFENNPDSIDESLCFVLMPFSNEYEQVYRALKETIEELGMTCLRADEIYSTGPILTDILHSILTARFIIADLTGKNPNVSYELGISHTRKPNQSVVLLSQDIDDVPFDLRHLRVLPYNSSAEGLRNLRTSLSSLLFPQEGQRGFQMEGVVETDNGHTTPQLKLPLNNSRLPGVSASLRWSNPPGTTQVQLYVSPINNDGPSLNLIFGAPLESFLLPGPLLGTGSFLLLPGATYTWRVRATRATTAIPEESSDWWPWTSPSIFTTASPTLGTIVLLSPTDGQVVQSLTPTLLWMDSNPAIFLYDLQVAKVSLRGDPGEVVLSVVVHGGESDPPNSFKVPERERLEPATRYLWRVRPRVQATPAGRNEVGVEWASWRLFIVDELKGLEAK